MSLIETECPNQALITLEQNEDVWFKASFLQSRRLGRQLFPPWITASPLGRLSHGCYWMASLDGAKSDTAQTHVAFAGPSSTGRFSCLTLTENEKYFVNLRNLVAIILEKECAPSKPMSSHIKGLISLHCWLIGHPLPVIFKGPARILLYGENLGAAQSERREHLVQQVAAFNAGMPFNVAPTETDGGLWSQFTNGLTLDSRLSVVQGLLLVEQVLPNRTSSFQLYKRLFGHLVLAAMIALIIYLLLPGK